MPAGDVAETFPDCRVCVTPVGVGPGAADWFVSAPKSAIPPTMSSANASTTTVTAIKMRA
jgi:hypothetical protein